MTDEPGLERCWVRSGRRHPAAAPSLALAVVLALAACQDGGGALGGALGGARDGAGGAARTTQLVETDIEAPEVFQVTDQGLWDGRPSLGGVWVAHPDVADPERVIIRNEATGQFVIGALFRRERENPGPALQVSSDAAEALAMLAGAPATLSVTALRREEAAEPEPTEATAPVGVPVEDREAPPAAAALSPEAVTTTALDAPAAVTAPPAPSSSEAGSPEAVARAVSAIFGAAASPASAPAAAEALPASALDRPFIQLGIFSVEANAEALAQQMTSQGLPARVVGSTTQGAEFFRVLVGPAATEAERATLLDRVAAEGFADAYAVRS